MRDRSGGCVAVGADRVAPLIVLLILALASAPVTAGEDDTAGITVEISLAGLVEDPGTYDVVAVVREAATGRLLAAPVMRFRGDGTAVTAVTTESGERISLSIGPVFRGRQAQWLVVWRRDGRTIARSGGRVPVFGEG